MTFLKTDSGKEVSDLSDEDLVDAIIKAADPLHRRSLQELLYTRYVDRVFFKCKSMTKDPDLAKDLTHDIMVKVLLNLNSFRGAARFYSWVMAISYNHCISYLTAEKKWSTRSFDETIGDQLPEGSELEDKRLLDMQLDQLEAIFPRLPEAEKVILLMRYQDGLSVKEIAALLQIGESAAKMRLKRSRDHLNTLFKETYHGEEA